MKLSDCNFELRCRILDQLKRDEKPAPKGLNPEKGRGSQESYRCWTKEEIEYLKEYYETHSTRLIFSIDEIAAKLGRSRWSITNQAGRMGFGNRERKLGCKTRKQLSKERGEAFKSLSKKERFEIYSARSKAQIIKYGHSRGMLGKNHSELTKSSIRIFFKGKKRSRESVIKGMKTNLEKYGASVPFAAKFRAHGSWKAQWASVGGQKFFARSSWEVNYARYLQLRKRVGEILSWRYEAKTFWFDGVRRGVVSYKPDFQVKLSNGKIEWHEVKGWMDSRSKTILKRMKKYHPLEVIVLIDSKRYKSLMKAAGGFLPSCDSIP